MVICLVVDGVSEMLPIPDSTITEVGNVRIVPQWALPYASGSACGTTVNSATGCGSLAFPDKMHHYSE